MVCGQLFHTGAPVVLWLDPGGYDAYRTVPRFSEPRLDRAGEPAEAARYNQREDGLSPEELRRVRGGGWDLPLLQRVVDQFVLHYDVAGTSRTCFKVLQDDRELSVHFMLDLDGTIYQTLDLKERAWHATKANSRSIGIEIAAPGARSPGQIHTLDEWYADGAEGTVLTLPSRFGDGGIRTPGFRPVTARSGLFRGVVNGSELVQYDFTPEQYESLAKLTAALCTVFPRMTLQYPKAYNGAVDPDALSDSAFDRFRGVLAHWHVQTNKVDPGPAFDWDRVIDRARGYMGVTPTGVHDREIGARRP